MCVSILLTKGEIRKWKKSQPDTITAYKVVEIGIGRDTIYPPVMRDHGPYQKTNKNARKEWTDSVLVAGKRRTFTRRYMAYYHLFFTKEGAEHWTKCRGTSGSEIILKCKVPKKAIIEVGRQVGSTVIVTKEFSFVEGMKYFRKAKKEQKNECHCTTIC